MGMQNIVEQVKIYLNGQNKNTKQSVILPEQNDKNRLV